MRPVILGMNDPSGREVLSPTDGAGRRLRQLLPELSDERYEAAFERRNLLPGRRWRWQEARAVGAYLHLELEGRTVVVLGKATWVALRLPRVDFFDEVTWRGVEWHLFPHPSGRSLVFNDPDKRQRASRLLSRLANR